MLTYTISALQPPAGADPQAQCEGMGVNADGVVAGTVWDEAHPRSEAVIWPESAGPTVLEKPPPDTRGWAINDAGDAVGFGVYPPPPPLLHPLLYRHETGQIEDFSKQLPAARYSFAFDLNNDDIVTGFTGANLQNRPFIYDATKGSVTLLDPLPGHATAAGMAINEAGYVAGGSAKDEYGQDLRAFIYRDGTMDDLGPVYEVRDVNNADVITGSAMRAGPTLVGPNAPPPTRAFRLDASVKKPRPELLGLSPTPGYFANQGFGINDDGVVVGWSGDVNGNYRAFIDIPNGEDAGFHDLQDVVVEADGWVLQGATGISNTGYIVGYGTYQGKNRSFLLTPAPDYWLKKKFEEVREVLLGFLVIFGGATVGGPGWGLLPGGKPVPIDPHGPMRERWEQMTEAERDFYLGLAIQHLDSIVSGGERGDIVQQAGRQIVESAMKELEGKGR
jgi:probable HAF family extracellular repeat protein